jgi:hypothetical protein
MNRTAILTAATVGSLLIAGCKSETEDKFPIAIAFGTPPTGLYEMHVGVDIGMVRMEGPKLGKKGGQLWDEWVTDHFKLVDAGGQTVKLSRANNSRLMPSNKIAGTFEFFLTAPVREGSAYTLTYQPRLDEKLKYRQKFTPKGKTDPLRTWFEPVGKKT